MTQRDTALFDLDGTVTVGNTYLAFLLGYLLRHPDRWRNGPRLGQAVALFGLGLRDNSWLKVRFLEAVLAGSSRTEINGFAERFLDRLRLRPGALAAIARHRAEGHRLVMATASFDFYAEPLAQRLGFDDALCTRSAWSAADRLLGSTNGANCYGLGKLERVRKALAPGPSGEALVHAYSDHHADLPLLRWADRPVAVNPTRKLRAYARRLDIPVADWGGTWLAQRHPRGASR